jgi:hypothetical protein
MINGPGRIRPIVALQMESRHHNLLRPQANVTLTVGLAVTSQYQDATGFAGAVNQHSSSSSLPTSCHRAAAL